MDFLADSMIKVIGFGWLVILGIYFGFFSDVKGCANKFFATFLSAIILSAITIKLYWLMALVLFVAGLAVDNKNLKTALIVISIVVLCVGRAAVHTSEKDSSDEHPSPSYSQEYEHSEDEQNPENLPPAEQFAPSEPAPGTPGESAVSESAPVEPGVSESSPSPSPSQTAPNE